MLLRGVPGGGGGGGVATTPMTGHIVVGPKIVGTDPPQLAASTQAEVNSLLALGVPSNNILWIVQGTAVS